MRNLLESSTTLSDFTIEKTIGKGSYGSVFLVRRKLDQKLYALKSVFFENLKQREQENSVNEVRLLASVSHPNVISYKEAFFDEKNNSLNIIMEYATDGDLLSEIIKKKENSELFQENIIWLYSIQMIEGLKALHDKKIMHRDIKSANIFLSNNKMQCKLGDMNVSKVIKEKVLTTQTGTPYYASPEVWRDEPYSYKSDLWSIGCVIYEMCALEPPFNGKDLDDLFDKICIGKIRRINKCYSDELWRMILMLLQNDVKKRVNCDEFLESDLIQKKIYEFKNNPNTIYDGYLLEKNKDLKNGNDVLLQTIKFNNFNDLKNNLPNIKNYENNDKKGNKNIIEYKCINNSLNTIISNSSMSKYETDINHNLNEGKVKLPFQKKNIKLKYINLMKENQNPNSITQSNINIEENNNIKINIQKSKDDQQIKNILFNRKQPPHIPIPKNENGRKKEFKYFEKIINRKREKMIIKRERGENNDINKNSFGNIYKSFKIKRNHSEKNQKILLKIPKESKKLYESSKINKIKTKNVIPRVNTEQKQSDYNKIINLNIKKITKKLNKSPNSNSIKIIENKNSSCSYKGIKQREIIPEKNKLKNIYFNIFNDYNTTFRKNKKIIPNPKTTTYLSKLIDKKYNKKKTEKLNIITNIPSLDSNNNINIKKNGRKKALLKEIFNTINFNSSKEDNNRNKKFLNFLCKGISASNIQRQKCIKNNQKILYKNKLMNLKGKRSLSRKNKIFLNESFNENNSTINKINTSTNNREPYNFIEYKLNSNKIDNLQKLFNHKIYSNILNGSNKPSFLESLEESKNKSKYDNNDSEIVSTNLNLLKKTLEQKKLNQKTQESNMSLSLRQRQKVFPVLNRCNTNQNNNNILKERNYIRYIIKKGKKKSINIKFKKLNIPRLYQLDRTKKNNHLISSKNLNSQKNMLDFDKIKFIKPYKEVNYNNYKKIKNNLNISEYKDLSTSDNHTFLNNMKNIYLDIKHNNKMKMKQKNIADNKRIITTISGNDLKDEKMLNNQIYNNFYSINNYDPKHPVKIINFFN